VFRRFWHSDSTRKIWHQLQIYSKSGRYSLHSGIFFKDLKHLEALVKVSRTSVPKEKPGGGVFQSHPDLTLPELAGESIGRIHDEGGVWAGGGEPGTAEPIKDEIPRGKVIVGRLDGRESEAVDGKGDRARLRCNRKRRGR
jgi:hypothetical protein